MAILADSWHAEEIGLRTVAEEKLPVWVARLATTNPIVRGATLWHCGRRHDIVALSGTGTTFRTVMLLERLRPRRRPYLVLLEFIPRSGQAAPDRGGLLRARVSLAFQRHVVGPVLRRSLLCAHSLSSWETRRNADMFSVEANRFVFIPWPLRLAGDASPPEGGRGRRILASGRAFCDWETVFAAADGQNWDLEVVCAQADLPTVRRLNRDGLAKVRCDIPLAEHRDMLKRCAVYLLALKEVETSSGQIRVMDAVRGGAPLVASQVMGLSDYVEDGETALLFAPGDVFAARNAVNAILANPALAERLRRTAFDGARLRTREHYLRAIRRLIESADGRAA